MQLAPTLHVRQLKSLHLQDQQTLNHLVCASAVEYIFVRPLSDAVAPGAHGPHPHARKPGSHASSTDAGAQGVFK